LDKQINVKLLKDKGTAVRYKKYPDNIKYTIAKTRNPDLYPELEIQRSTANYWIKTYLNKDILESDSNKLHFEMCGKISSRVDLKIIGNKLILPSQANTQKPQS
jgi:hypothetical protein